MMNLAQTNPPDFPVDKQLNEFSYMSLRTLCFKDGMKMILLNRIKVSNFENGGEMNLPFNRKNSPGLKWSCLKMGEIVERWGEKREWEQTYNEHYDI